MASGRASVPVADAPPPRNIAFVNASGTPVSQLRDSRAQNRLCPCRCSVALGALLTNPAGNAIKRTRRLGSRKRAIPPGTPSNAMKGASGALFACLGFRSHTQVCSLILALKKRNPHPLIVFELQKKSPPVRRGAGRNGTGELRGRALLCIIFLQNFSFGLAKSPDELFYG